MVVNSAIIEPSGNSVIIEPSQNNITVDAIYIWTDYCFLGPAQITAEHKGAGA